MGLQPEKTRVRPFMGLQPEKTRVNIIEEMQLLKRGYGKNVCFVLLVEIKS